MERLCSDLNTRSFQMAQNSDPKPKLGWIPNHDQTATPNTGTTDLWKEAKKMTMMALAWKLLKALEAEGIGVAEVEAQAEHRS